MEKTFNTATRLENRLDILQTSSQAADATILNVLRDLFAGRTKTAFGEPLDWWAETCQCDLNTEAPSPVLMAIREWLCHQPASAELHGEFARQNPL